MYITLIGIFIRQGSIMKKTVFVLLFAVFVFFTASANGIKELKVLTIGNSFADSVFTFLPDIAKSFPDCKLELDRANLGGCSLLRHWRIYARTQRNPKNKEYYVYKNKSIPHYSLQEKLVEKKWDIITIHQGSTPSPDWNTYEPYAGLLIAKIRKLAPQAEIVIQQTWNYRADAPHFQPGHKWGFGQQEMYNRLDDCYRKLAEKYNLRIIPVGLSVQKYREKTPVKFNPCPPEELKKLKMPTLPDQSGAILGSMRWMKDKKTQQWYIRTDFKHLNAKGQYMQACVWFGFLFNKKCTDIKFIPDKKFNISATELELLKNCAQQALDEYKQIKK